MNKEQNKKDCNLTITVFFVARKEGFELVKDRD